MPTRFEVEFGGEQVVLLANRMLWWPRQRTLFAADLHAGKAEHMRRYGLAIPGGNLQADLQILAETASECGAARLIFLGDLFHSEVNTEWGVFADWCKQQAFSIELVKGNHDRFLTDTQFAQAEIVAHNEPYYLNPFTLKHHPNEQFAADEHVLAGHIHPVFWLHGPAQDRLRVPCFWQQPQQMILPAFGSFTGGYNINKFPAVNVFPCASMEILKTGPRHMPSNT